MFFLPCSFLTVPDTSHIIYSQPVSSTSFAVNWTEVHSADHYYLVVKSVSTGESFNLTFTTHSTVVENLKPSTTYDCYIYTSNQAGLGIPSKARTVTTLVSPPEFVMAEHTGPNTARVRWQPVKNVLMYRVIIRVADDPVSKLYEQDIINTEMNMMDTRPCTTYLISVSSLNKFLVPSESTDHVYTTNTLKPITFIKAEYSCITNVAEVSWSAVYGAKSYEATATDMDGVQMNCTSTSPSCFISGLTCGQSYIVHVTPITENCRNKDNTSIATFDTAPCAPRNLRLDRQCTSNVIDFSWEHANGTSHYMAESVDSKGVTKTCLTMDSSCFFTQTVCGRLYSFKVYSFYGMCRSQISDTVEIHTAEGAINYTVEAFGNRHNSYYNCSSFSNSCSIEDIHCGEYLTVFVTASDDQCTSPRSMAQVAETGPCIPLNVQARRDCGADSITVTWAISSGALTYVSKAVDSDGIIHTCSSPNLSCKIDGLKCGTNYTMSSNAANTNCQSFDSEIVFVETAPCPPDNLKVIRDCAANEALLSWEGQPHMISYIGVMTDEDGGLLSCSTSETSCRIGDLRCDQLYSVTISHDDGICASVPSNPVYMESVPCGPANVMTNVDCESGELTVDWKATTNAESYMTVISDSTGYMSFNMTEPQLSVTTLECGLEYTLKVMSITGSCLSFPSETKTIRQVPCVPVNVNVEKNCDLSSVNLSWDASRGANIYTATALGLERRRLECSSSETSCVLDNLRCSQVYNITVVAVDDYCSSLKSDVLILKTAPCPPSGLTVSVDCASNSATLNWNTSPNAVSYTGNGGDGNIMTCEVGMETSCQIDGLHCGEEYTFSVSATDGECRSAESMPVTRTAAPCAAHNILESLDCSTNALTVSWTPGSLPVNYSVTAFFAVGDVTHSCFTEGSTCEMTNLQCGQEYTVTVKAVSSTCEGPSRTLPPIPSVPCVPANIHGAVECSSNNLQMSWDATAGALSYISTLNRAGGFTNSCNSSIESCQFPSLQCAQTYTFSVMAINQRCKSPTSNEGSVITAPCDPTNVAADLDCSSGVVTVTWEASAGAAFYTVVAQDSEGDHASSCKSTGTSCELHELQCGKEYTVIVLAGDRSCNSTMLAKTAIRTAPCNPVIKAYPLDCYSNHASVSWVKDEDALDVEVSAVSAQRHSTSCSSATNASCVLDDLLCGNTYTVQAVARGEKCYSKPSSTFEIVTAPCTPEHVEYTYSCENGITLLTWDDALGRTSFDVTVQSEDQTEVCPTTETVCSFTTLRCGHLYAVEVLSVASHCNSHPGTTEIQTAPCAPERVTASLLCEDNTAEVNWLPSFGAVLYNVTADNRDGDIKRCSSSTTSCHIPHMLCGQNYIITVTPSSTTCVGIKSEPIVYVTGPCPPTDIQAFLQCDGNVVHVSWTAAVLADLYVATLSHGHDHTCNSSSTSCSLADVQCGEIGFISLVTIERGCYSDPSNPMPLSTAICPPTGVTAMTACANNDVIVRWDRSPRSGVTYTVHSQLESGASATYSTGQTSYVITGLPCGEKYTIRVTATDSECTSILSESAHNETVPCPPTSLTAKPECSINRATLTWEPSSSAMSYTATVTGEHDHVASCSSNTTSCSVRLDCGRQYTAVVMSFCSNCNSITGAILTFDSAPCLPGDVVAELDCTLNSFRVQWSANNGGDISYTATAIGSDHSRETCDSPNTACTIQNLKCGLTYSIVVTTSSIDCGVIEDSDYKMQSAPCKPENPVANLDCMTSIMVVNWENTGPSQEIVVTAEDTRLITTTCESTGFSCTFDQLTCGETYEIILVGRAGKCSSEPSVVPLLHTAPCVPTHLEASVDCNTGIIVVNWDKPRGATDYSVYANGNFGHSAVCTSTDTFCDFSALACGQDYGITVVAHNEHCDSLTDLKATLDCSTNTAQVSWTPGRGIVVYNATTDSFDSSNTLSCSTSNSTCNIHSLPCGESFRVAISGEGRKCSSPSFNWERVDSVPCPPTQLMVDSSCESNNISVSWVDSQGSLSYMAVAEDTQGTRLSCNTSTTTCQINNLLCGEQYKVYVLGKDSFCYGIASDMKVINTAPCVPQAINHHLDCPSGDLNVTWEQTRHASHFRVIVESSSGEVSACNSDEPYCMIHGLRCGQTYSYEVVAQNTGCSNSRSPKQEVTTAPCPPTSFMVPVNCDTGVVSVIWNNSVPGVRYIVTAVDTAVPCVPHLAEVEMDCLSSSPFVVFDDAAGADNYVIMATNSMGATQTFECNSADSCTPEALECSQNFTFTVKARDSQCSSAPSNALTAETPPCTPQNIFPAPSCKNNTVTVFWSPSPGAVMYMATLEKTNGDTICCHSAGSSCDIKDLPCGEVYTVLVVAEGQTCNSSQSSGDIVRTEPCVPQNLQANLSCRDNVAYMMWDHSKGGELYRVRAVGTDGHVDECSFRENHCDLIGLHCGQYYTATVVAEVNNCASYPSDSVQIKTIPCTPQNISSVINCEANSLMISWSESSGADSYLATLQYSDGLSTTCQAANKSYCSMTGLSCGQIYHTSVISSDGFCDSPSSAVVDTPSVPCESGFIKAAMDCYLKVAMVSWYPSNGAVLYKATATTVSGHAVMCETTGTSCDLGGLLCSQSYSISVRALGETCNSISHMRGELVTEPCTPKQINPVYSVGILQVLWDPSAGATQYTAKAETDQGLGDSCTATEPYCFMHNLVCGQTYNVNVTAHSSVCDLSTSTEEVSFNTGLDCGRQYIIGVTAIGEKLNSTQSEATMLVSAPCAAENVVADVDCENDRATVSWTASEAESYMVTVIGSNGHQAFCRTSDTNCDLTELQCGQMYNISLTVISNDCETLKDIDASFSTRPCKPMDIGVDMECGTSTANLYWEETEGVELYVATASSSMGSVQCNSTNSTCQLHDLMCGEAYTLSVTAYSYGCHSDVSSSSIVEFQTDPCQPVDVTVTGSCDNNTVALDWSEAKGTSTYIVSVTGDLGYVTGFQTSETTLNIALPCGQEYTFTVKAQDDRCDSPVSQPVQFRTSPCVPQHVGSYIQCEDSLGSVSWAPSDGAESYMAVAVGLDEHTHICISNTTTCTWDDLHCGEHYTVEVTANYYQCSSLPSESTMIRMAPCIPQNLKASMNCDQKVASLTWNATETADFYIVTAETNNGHKVQLSTSDTFTFISEFMCGQEYFLSVQAEDSVCRSAPSIPEMLNSVPCPPTGVSSNMDCLTNIAVISWTASAGAEFYAATVTGEDGHKYTCMSDRTVCGLSNIDCGQINTVTVVASSTSPQSYCDSDPSEPDTLQSPPCVPTAVEVTLDCSNNTAVVSWSPSRGALEYHVTAQSTLGAVSSCQSTDTECTLTNLVCGHTYHVKVAAQDNICSSLPSLAETVYSVPCTPNPMSVILDCYTNSALPEWSYSEGAMRYTTTARSASNSVSTCTTNSTNCELGQLQCGQTYSVTTVASNDQCDSPPSDSLEVTSLPCPPEDVSAVFDCPANTAHVAWQSGTGADSYIVQAIGVEEHVSRCETDGRSCVIPDLMCGFIYGVSVISVNSECNVSRSAITELETAPCVPNLMEANVNCDSGVVAVSWEQSKGAHYYTVTAQGNGGYESSHNSSQTSFEFDDLLCGLSYSVTVSASDDSCISAESNAKQINTVPCVPQKATAQIACNNDTGLVSWEEGEGVSSYLVQAVGPDGHRTGCGSTQSSCQLPNLHCGQLYNLTLTAGDGQCDSRKAYFNLQSAPCSPTNVKAALQCHSSAVAVTWERSSGATSYYAHGVTVDGTHHVQCNNTETFCDLHDLMCGQTYIVNLVAKDDTCSSVESDRVVVRTAPCTPEDVYVDVQCAEGCMDVSWSPNPDAEYFHVEAVSDSGILLYCNSTDTNCTLWNLPCGQSYSITVVSVRDGCESKPSPVKEFCSVPCVPKNPRGSLDCVTNFAWVSWDDTKGAYSYFVLAQEAGGHSSNCTTSSSSCSVPDLKCASLYTFHVTAINDNCDSDPSETFELETGPCALSSVTAVSECNSDQIHVEWVMGEELPVYVVSAEGEDKTIISCNSTTNTCLLEDAKCGLQYTITVSASSDKCSSLRSPPKKINTAPCKPSDITTVPVCEDNGVVVSWAHSTVATSYQLTAMAQDGDVRTLTTTTNSVTLTELHCSQRYTISITASADNCTSHAGTVIFRTVPCEPVGLRVEMQCETNSAFLSWESRVGSVRYIASSQSKDEDQFFCQSTDTSCTIHGLTCGSIYNFTVEGNNGICNTPLSAPLQGGAAPCPPTSVSVRMQQIGDRHWAMVSWNAVNCSIVEYQAAMIGRIQDSPETLMDVASYWLPRPYFEFPVPCSTTYDLTIRSRNAAGTSEPSSVFVGITVPCPPQNVRYTGDTQSATLFWDASVLATKYSVYSVSGLDRVEVCSTAGLSCNVINFDPATTELTASNDVGESIPTSAITGPVLSRRRRDLRDSGVMAVLEW
ncbi:hypothetical protein LDENG_00272160 [Lucifuga dentata]|nr:hypothetical protein LDENG_00272160 [Lucifuga dentata]